MVEHLFMVLWVIGLISHGGHIELFLISQCPTTGLTKSVWYVPSCMLHGKTSVHGEMGHWIDLSWWTH